MTVGSPSLRRPSNSGLHPSDLKIGLHLSSDGGLWSLMKRHMQVQVLFASFPADIRNLSTWRNGDNHSNGDGGYKDSSAVDFCKSARERLPQLKSIPVQMFIGNPKRPKELETDSLCGLSDEACEAFIDTVDGANSAVHASHGTNLLATWCSSCKGICHDTTHKTKALAALESLEREMNICRQLNTRTLCVHLGGSIDESLEVNIDRAASVLVTLLQRVDDVELALENATRSCATPTEQTTGTFARNVWGLSSLKMVIDRVKQRDPDNAPRVKVCVDICHAHIAHYDLTKTVGVNKMLQDLAALGGHVSGFHVSNSSVPHGRKCDGHMNIKNGLISNDTFRRILSPYAHLPMYLETPAFSSVRSANVSHDFELQRHVVECMMLKHIISTPHDEYVEPYHDKIRQIEARIRKSPMSPEDLATHRKGRAKTKSKISSVENAKRRAANESAKESAKESAIESAIESAKESGGGSPSSKKRKSAEQELREQNAREGLIILGKRPRNGRR